MRKALISWIEAYGNRCLLCEFSKLLSNCNEFSELASALVKSEHHGKKLNAKLESLALDLGVNG